MKYKEGDECFLNVGNNNDIREFASIDRSSKANDNAVLGDNNLIMGACHVTHECKLGSGNILANGTLLGGNVVVEVEELQCTNFVTLALMHFWLGFHGRSGCANVHDGGWRPSTAPGVEPGGYAMMWILRPGGTG